jgi:multiple sugar transport system permease protein
MTGAPRMASVRGRPPLARRAGIWAVLLVVAVPTWWVVAGALSTPGGVPPRTIVWWPSSPTLGNLAAAFDAVPLGRYLVNSLLVAAVAVPVSVVVASTAGFAIARLGGRAAALLVGVCVAAAMVPPPSLAVGRITVFRTLGVTDTPVPLLAPALLGMSPLLVLLYAWSFRRLPPSVFDLARETGLSPAATWRRVAMPLVRPTTAAVAVLAFVLSWGDLLSPLFYVHDERWFTLPLGLRSLGTLPVTEQPVVLAGALVAAVPAVLALAGLQRWLGRAA